MRIDPITSAKRDFARSAAYRRDQELFFKETEKRLKEDRVADRIDADAAELATMAVLATETEIAEFRAELDEYRTATTEALLENERELAKVRAEIDDMLERAYVLPDGRRVFKTKDGLRVFDEHGVELGNEIIDPDAIEEWRPHADGYLDRRAVESGLVSEREGLLSIEHQIDAADERAKSGEMTRDELEEFRDELEESMPLAARRKPADYKEPVVTEIAPVEELDISDDMVPTTSKPPSLAFDR